MNWMTTAKGRFSRNKRKSTFNNSYDNKPKWKKISNNPGEMPTKVNRVSSGNRNEGGVSNDVSLLMSSSVKLTSKRDKLCKDKKINSHGSRDSRRTESLSLLIFTPEKDKLSKPAHNGLEDFENGIKYFNNGRHCDANGRSICQDIVMGDMTHVEDDCRESNSNENIQHLSIIDNATPDDATWDSNIFLEMLQDLPDNTRLSILNRINQYRDELNTESHSNHTRYSNDSQCTLSSELLDTDVSTIHLSKLSLTPKSGLESCYSELNAYEFKSMSYEATMKIYDIIRYLEQVEKLQTKRSSRDPTLVTSNNDEVIMIKDHLRKRQKLVIQESDNDDSNQTTSKLASGFFKEKSWPYRSSTSTSTFTINSSSNSNINTIPPINNNHSHNYSHNEITDNKINEKTEKTVPSTPSTKANQVWNDWNLFGGNTIA